MRRQDREVKDQAALLAMLDHCQVAHVAFNNGTYPYVVPLSFGWEQLADGHVALYVHGAREGLRHQLAAADPHVGVALQVFDRYVQIPHGITCAYQSLIGTGVVEVLEGKNAVHGLDLIVAHCGFAGYRCPEETLGRTSVWRIVLHSLTGKKNDL